MEKRYVVRRWEGSLPELEGRVFKPEGEAFCSLEAAVIANYPWAPDGYCPEARAYLARTDEGLAVLMCAREAEIIAAETEFGGMVCRDSCLEFFLNPCPAKGETYINVEVNAAGVAHIGIGEGRHGRRVLQEMPEGMCIARSRHDGAWWAVSYILPWSLLQECCGEPEAQMRANFYTCDETIHPHFGTWNPVDAAQPDFHRPECFGWLQLED